MELQADQVGPLQVAVVLVGGVLDVTAVHHDLHQQRARLLAHHQLTIEAAVELLHVGVVPHLHILQHLPYRLPVSRL